jgi:hypothetical protein
MSETSIKVLRDRVSGDAFQSEYIEPSKAENPFKTRKSPFPSVENVLGDIEKCINARKLFAQKQF